MTGQLDHVQSMVMLSSRLAASTIQRHGVSDEEQRLLTPALVDVCASANVCVNALRRGERPDRRYRIGADRTLAKALGQVRTWGLTGSKPAPLANSFSVCP